MILILGKCLFNWSNDEWTGEGWYHKHNVKHGIENILGVSFFFIIFIYVGRGWIW